MCSGPLLQECGTRNCAPIRVSAANAKITANTPCCISRYEGTRSDFGQLSNQAFYSAAEMRALACVKKLILAARGYIVVGYQQGQLGMLKFDMMTMNVMYE